MDSSMMFFLLFVAECWISVEYESVISRGEKRPRDKLHAHANANVRDPRDTRVAYVLPFLISLAKVSDYNLDSTILEAW